MSLYVIGLHFKVADFVSFVNFERHNQNKVVEYIKTVMNFKLQPL